jgi:hypothetical protein
MVIELAVKLAHIGVNEYLPCRPGVPAHRKISPGETAYDRGQLKYLSVKNNRSNKSE